MVCCSVDASAECMPAAIRFFDSFVVLSCFRSVLFLAIRCFIVTYAVCPALEYFRLLLACLFEHPEMGLCLRFLFVCIKNTRSLDLYLSTALQMSVMRRICSQPCQRGSSNTHHRIGNHCKHECVCATPVMKAWHFPSTMGWSTKGYCSLSLRIACRFTATTEID